MIDFMEAKKTMERLEELNAVIKHKKAQSGISYYTPNPVQYKAHQSKADYVLLCGANRIGKSTFGAVELTYHLTRDYPDWFPYERKFHHPIKAIVVATENQIIEKVIEPKLFQYLPSAYIEHTKRITGNYLNRLTCKDGSTVDFLTGEQDNMAFEGHDWDFYWGDEPQKERKFQAIQRGLVDRHGKAVITFTPLVEPWMKEHLVDKADGKRIDVITATMRDNKFDIKGNPILAEEDIALFEKDLPEDVRETRIYGRFFHLRGVVYVEFSEIHCIDFDYHYPDPVVCVLDPHDRQPHHVIWAIVDRTDDLFVHSELSLHCTVGELASAIKAVESSMSYVVRRRIIDPNFGRKPLITTGKNIMQELASSGCRGWMEGIDFKEEGRLKVKEYLHYNKKEPISHTNRPKLYFHKARCPLTIHSVRNHQYDEWRGQTGSERDPKERIKDKDTHGADDVRYLCMSNPTYERFKESPYELSEVPY